MGKISDCPTYAEAPDSQFPDSQVYRLAAVGLPAGKIFTLRVFRKSPSCLYRCFSLSMQGFPFCFNLYQYNYSSGNIIASVLCLFQKNE